MPDDETLMLRAVIDDCPFPDLEGRREPQGTHEGERR